MTHDMTDGMDGRDGPRPTAVAAPGWALPTRSVHGLGIALRLLLLADLVVAVVTLLLAFRLDDLVDRLLNDRATVSLSEATTLQQLSDLADTAWICTYLATGVVWLVWLYRARENVEAWSPQFQRSGPRAAIGAWFIPVVNLFWPARIMRDVLEDTKRDPTEAWSDRRGQPLVTVWAVGFAAMWLSSLWVRLKSSGADSVRGLPELTSAVIVDGVITVIAVLPALLLVGQLTEAQQRRIELDRYQPSG